VACADRCKGFAKFVEAEGDGAELRVPGDVDDHDALITSNKKEQLQQLGSLVVKRGLPPVFDDEFGNQDGDLTSRVVAFKL
jgi:hypothetical protein